MPNETEYKGRCFCGAVELRVAGAPAAMGYCHCTSCRSWSASPVNAFALWPPHAVTITRGADQLASYQKTANSLRRWCKTCGGHVLTEHPSFELIDVYATVIEGLPFRAMLHVNYGETVLPMADGLPKQKDFLQGDGRIRHAGTRVTPRERSGVTDSISRTAASGQPLRLAAAHLGADAYLKVVAS